MILRLPPDNAAIERLEQAEFWPGPVAGQAQTAWAWPPLRLLFEMKTVCPGRETALNISNFSNISNIE